MRITLLKRNRNIPEGLCPRSTLNLPALYLSLPICEIGLEDFPRRKRYPVSPYPCIWYISGSLQSQQSMIGLSRYLLLVCIQYTMPCENDHDTRQVLQMGYRQDAQVHRYSLARVRVEIETANETKSWWPKSSFVPECTAEAGALSTTAV